MSLKSLLIASVVVVALVAQPTPTISQQNSSPSQADQAGVKIETLLQTSSAWDGTRYTAYPSGQPQITVRRMTIAPHTALGWHTHAMPTMAYVLSGELTVEKKDGTRKHFSAGEAVVETVDTVHRGFTGDQAVTLIVFYPGVQGMPLSQPAR